jgi:hypothetical protein
MKKTTPKARNEDIVVQNLQNEILLYDLKINKAYCLNETAGLVYQFCDGQTSFDELRRKSGKDISDEIIWLAIEELNKQDLLSEKTESGISRRSLLQKAAASVVALPLVTMIVAPRALQAQSGNCSPDGTPTGGQTTQFGDFICFQEVEPPCCTGEANVDFDTCVFNPQVGFVCDCVCGPQIGDFPDA